jgi:hypothetical protein
VLVTGRVLGAALAGPVLAGYAVTVALVALLSATADARWSVATTARAAAPLWLAAHQVPLTVTVPGGPAAPLGVLPMLPTLGLVLLVAWAAAGVVARLDWRTPGRIAGLAAVFAATHAGLGVLVALVEPTARMTAAPVTAGFGCAAVAGLAAAAGGLRAAGVRMLASALPPWAVRGTFAGLAGVAWLLAAGALCTFGGLVLSAGTVRSIIAGWGGTAGGEFGVTVLSVAYLPNAVVAGTSWLAGPGLSIGAVSVTPFGTGDGVLPAVPLLAAIPEAQPAPWRLLVFVLPVLVGLLVGRRCRWPGSHRTDRLHATVTAGVVAAAGCFVLAVLAGGRLGGGVFDPVRIPPSSLAVAVFGWIVLPAALVVAFRGRAADRPEPDADADSEVAAAAVETAVETAAETADDLDDNDNDDDENTEIGAGAGASRPRPT